MAILPVKYLQWRDRRGWSLSLLVAVLGWNLFQHKDLWAWLDVDDPPGAPPGVPDHPHLALGLPGWTTGGRWSPLTVTPDRPVALAAANGGQDQAIRTWAEVVARKGR